MYRKNLFVRVQSIDCVTYLVKNYDAYELDEVGSIVWNSLDGSTDIGEIISKIASQYSVKEDIVSSDVLAFCAEMLENGLLEEFLCD